MQISCQRVAPGSGYEPGDAGSDCLAMPASERGRRGELLARGIIAGALVSATMLGAVPAGSPPKHATPELGDAGISATPDGLGGSGDRGPREGDDRETRMESQAAADWDAGLAQRVSRLVAGRMPNPDPAASARVAQAVLDESALAGVDPLLVLALIHVESSFDPDAQSDRGAVGLMQLREPTMRDVLERSGLPVADARDPVANVQAGVRYLGGLLGSFSALDHALMAYNAGPTKIRSHLRDGMIPYRYRVYPQKVRKELADLKTTFGAAAPRALVGSQPQTNSKS